MLKIWNWLPLNVVGVFIVLSTIRVVVANIDDETDTKPPPKPSVILDSEYFLEGETFVLNCTTEYKISHTVNLTWNISSIIPNETVFYDTNTKNESLKAGILYTSLKIVNASKAHEGTYICVSANNCGKEKIAVKKVYLKSPFLELKNIFFKSGHIINSKLPAQSFEVDVNSYPTKIDYYILRNDHNITLDSNKYKLVFEKVSKIRTITFTIYNTSLNDTGNYTVVVRNKYETKRLTFDYRRQAPPVIYMGGDKKVMQNQTVTFECEVTGYPLPSISWSFSSGAEEKNLTSTELITSFYEETARLRLPVHISGNVTCSATNNFIPGGVDKSETRQLLVYEVPDGFGIESFKDEFDEDNDENLWLWEKRNVSIKCYASIYDFDSVMWYTNESEVPGNMSYSYSSPFSHIAVLNFNEITLEHSGTYTCKATRKDYNILSKDIQLTVAPIKRSTIRVPEASRKHEVSLFQPIELHCQADGVPPPQITWEKDGKLLSNGSGVEIITKQLNKTLINSTIYINYMKEENKGKYDCVAYGDGVTKKSYVLEFKVQRSYTVILIVVLVIIIVLILVVAYLAWKNNKAKRFKKELEAAGLWNFKEGGTGSLNPDLGIDEQAELLPYDEKFEFPPEKLIFGKQLGSGAFGVVYKADARGIINAEETTPVAVKMVKKNADNMYIKALASELKIMVHLGKHVNIVNLLGACTKNVGKRELIVIVEYCKFGNIHNYMQRHREVFIDQLTDNKDKNMGKVNRGFSCSSGGSTGGHSDYFGSTNTQETDHTFLNTGNTNRDTRKASEGYIQPEWRTNYESDYIYDGRNPRPLTSRDLLAWAFQIARGMEYLASRKILHGDLAARNVLLAEDNIVKICDFGLAKSIYKNDEYQKKENSPLPIKWLALECMIDRIFSTQSDVWSFGIVLWELFTLAKTPYPNISPANLVQWLNDGNRLDKPTYADDRLYEVMKSCWEQKPTARPSFSRLQEILGTFLEDNVRNHYVDLNSAYMSMNMKQEGKEDYLDMVCAPDYKNLVTPSPHHYANTNSFFPNTPAVLDEEGYLMMNQMPFSPRLPSTTFDFDPRRVSSRKSEVSSGSESTPMLALHRIQSRSGSDSDPEGPGPMPNGCPRIAEESDEVFEVNDTKHNNEKNCQIQAAVTNPTYITFDLDDKPKDIINSYANINLAVPNGLVK